MSTLGAKVVGLSEHTWRQLSGVRGFEPGYCMKDSKQVEKTDRVVGIHHLFGPEARQGSGIAIVTTETRIR